MSQQMALSSLSSGRAGETATRKLFSEHGWSVKTNKEARIPDPTGTNLKGFLMPDLLVHKGDQEWVIEVKSNGPIKGSMYHKWIYQALRHSFTGRKTLFVFNLAEPNIFKRELRFLREAVASMNLEFVLLSDLPQWLAQK